MLTDFDVKVLDDPEFQEDSVREEIIGPIIKYLGYSPSQSPKVVRSRKLVHPFVNIGSKTHKVNIIPDYVLEIDGSPLVILDAKSPHTSLLNSSHAEQAYSYAIHPEIRAKIYSLCNGRQWIFWDIDKFDPVAVIDIIEIVKDVSVIEKYLHPKAVLFPSMRDFQSDYGLRMKKLGLADDAEQLFISNPITNIMKVETNLYTISLSTNFDDEDFLISFDLNEKLYQELLSLFPEPSRSKIISNLSRQPFSSFDIDPIDVMLRGKFGKPTRGQYEDFVPIVVSELQKL